MLVPLDLGGGRTMKGLTWLLLGGFVLFFINTDPVGAGNTMGDFIDLLGELAGNLNTFLSTVFSDAPAEPAPQ
jgi:hypothetical protein